MRLLDTLIIDSPDRAGYVRLVAKMAFDTLDERLEPIYVEVPAACAAGLSTSGNPWFAAMLFAAATLGEPLTINQPVDRTLYENGFELMRVWHNWGWTPQRFVPVNVAVTDDTPGTGGTRMALFFTGGVDSMFSLLTDTPEFHPERAERIADLVHVWGNEIRLDQPAVFAALHERHRLVADEQGKTLIDLKTNLRVLLDRCNWTARAFGSAFATLALALENRWRRVLVASDRDYSNTIPWGTHPLLTPLWSTRRLDMIHDGTTHTRQQKTSFLGASPLAQRTLRVCWHPGATGNCSRCSKCVRTMIALDVAGALDKFPVFDTTHYHEDVARTMHRAHLRYFIEESREEARARGRTDIVAMLDRVLAPKVLRRDRLERTLRRWLLPEWAAHAVAAVASWGYGVLKR